MIRPHRAVGLTIKNAKTVEKNNFIVAVDLGSSNVVAAAASKTPDGKLHLLDVVVKPMEGMKSGEVTNIEQVTASAKEAVGELEENLGITIREAYTGISGRDIRCTDTPYFVFIGGDGGEIRQEDVDKLHESMANLQPADGVCILERTPQKYIIDSREETMQPVGRFGQKLESVYNFTLGNKNSVDRLAKAFNRLEIRQRRLFTNAQASAVAVLNDDEKEVGVAMVDIGAGCTDVCIWHDNIMRYVGVVPIGSDAINKDIGAAAIPNKYIEKLKTAHGRASANRIKEEEKDRVIQIKSKTSRANTEILLYALAQIIEARVMDIVDYVIEEIKDSGYADKLGAGIVLTGGGSYLRDIEAVFKDKTKYEIRTGTIEPNLLSEESLEAADDMRLSTAIGLLLLGAKDCNLEATNSPLRKRTKGERTEGTIDIPTTGDSTNNGNNKTGTGSKPPKKKKEKEKKKGGIFSDILDGIKKTFTIDVIDDEI